MLCMMSDEWQTWPNDNRRPPGTVDAPRACDARYKYGWVRKDRKGRSHHPLPSMQLAGGEQGCQHRQCVAWA